jgi:hypothetical protein
MIARRARPRPVARIADDDEPEVDERRGGHVSITVNSGQGEGGIGAATSLGLGSIIVGCLSIFLCFVPGIGMATSAAADGIGVWGLVVSTRNRNSGIGLAVAGVALGAAAFMLNVYIMVKTASHYRNDPF